MVRPCHFLSTFPIPASSPSPRPGIHFQVQAVGGTCCFCSHFLPSGTEGDLSEVCVPLGDVCEQGRCERTWRSGSGVEIYPEGGARHPFQPNRSRRL